MEFNKCQSSLEELEIKKYPQEVQEQFYDFLNNVPYIRWLVSKDRPLVSELPRDEGGRAIIDITKPPILENTDYFRYEAIKYKEIGKYNELRPNANPNSDYGKWLKEEVKRCFEGYTDPSTGMWITGDLYFFLNYCPIQLHKKDKQGKSIRVIDFPNFWDGHWLVTQYLQEARQKGHHAAMLSKRGAGKSFLGAALLAKRFLLGESQAVNKKVQCVVTAADRKYIYGANQILNMFVSYIDFCANTTQFPQHRLVDSAQSLRWEMGYKDKSSGVRRGSLNSVMGITSGDDQTKLNGSRGVLYLVEEAGIFSNLLSLYQMIRPSVEDGNAVYGLLYLYGTAGDDESDFTSLQEIMYNPRGYNMQALPNVYDKEGQGRKEFTIFYPAYLNRAECMDKDGNSNVTKALLELLIDRYNVKYNSTDINSITKRISQYPITPQEAIIRSHLSIFPITELNERLNQLDNNPNEYDDVYVGELIQNKAGKVEFRPTTDVPIREFPTKDNKVSGALEIYSMPQKNSTGEVPQERYILSSDPFNSDGADTMSLGSIFVLDLWTDTLVAEYTGRPLYTDDYFEMCRKLCLFYNGQLCYEAHPYDQVVRLPNGTTKKWEDVHIGDTLFAPNGNTVSVVNIPIDGIDDIYKITLADGRTVEASKHHIWSVYKLGSRNKRREVTTEQMIREGCINKHGQKRFFIPDSGVINYPHRDVPIDPYTLGLLIAEGAFTKFRKNKVYHCNRKIVQFSASLQDGEYYKEKIPYPIKYIGTKGYSWHLYKDNIDLQLEELGLLYKNSLNKFIPDLYLYNDYTTRLELLKGLMDGDGCAVNKGASVYITISPQLKDDIMLLCRSLGIKCQEQKGKPEGLRKCPKKQYYCQQIYRVSISADIPIFSLPRKKEKQHIYSPTTKGSKAKGFLKRTGITKIEYVGKKPCKCVTVSAKDGLYLIGDYVVTHNCNLKGTFSYFSQHNCTYLLADTPEYLKDKQLIKSIGYGNSSKGITATNAIKAYGYRLIRDWLIKPITKVEKEGEQEHEVTIANLYRIRNRALLKELILWNPDINVDRISSLIQLMLYREEKMILYQGDMNRAQHTTDKGLEDDDYFTRNYAVYKHKPKQFRWNY